MIQDQMEGQKEHIQRLEDSVNLKKLEAKDLGNQITNSEMEAINT